MLFPDEAENVTKYEQIMIVVFLHRKFKFISHGVALSNAGGSGLIAVRSAVYLSLPFYRLPSIDQTALESF